jgi:hypothetical protein
MDRPNNLDWIWTQLDLGNEAPGWTTFEPGPGFDGLVRLEDGAKWARRTPNGDWERRT